MLKKTGKLTYALRCMSMLLLLALVLGNLSATRAQAAGNPVDLELSGEGASSWNISNIKPGDSGTKSVTLKNTGTNAGKVTIWVSDIVSTEGANPESETSDTAEPGELDAYLALNLTSDRLTTNIVLPVTLNQFPQSLSSPTYIRISPLNAGETLDLTWHWALPPGTNNDVQGDGVSFTINYTIEELPAPPAGGGGNGEASGTGYGLLIITETREVSSSTSVELSVAGRTQQAVSVSDLNRDFMLTVESGTQITSNEVEIPRILKIRLSDEVLQALGGNEIIRVSPLYEITAFIGNKKYGSVAFDQPVKITLHYDARLVPDKSASIFIGMLRNEQTIIKLPTEVGLDADGAYAQALTTMLATVAVFVEMPLPAYEQAGGVSPVFPAGSADDNMVLPPGLGGAGLFTPQDELAWSFKTFGNGDESIKPAQKDIIPIKRGNNTDTLPEVGKATGRLLVTIFTIFSYVATSIVLLFVFVFRTRPA